MFNIMNYVLRTLDVSLKNQALQSLPADSSSEASGGTSQTSNQDMSGQTSINRLVIGGRLWVVDSWLLINGSSWLHWHRLGRGALLGWVGWLHWHRLRGRALDLVRSWHDWLGLAHGRALGGHGWLHWLGHAGSGAHSLGVALAFGLGDGGLAAGVDDSDDLLLNRKSGRVNLGLLGLGGDDLGEGLCARLALDRGHNRGLDGLVRDGLGFADGGDLESVVWDGVGLCDGLGLDVGRWDEFGNGDLLWDLSGLGHCLSDGLDDSRGSLGWDIGSDGLVDSLAGAAGLAVLLRRVRCHRGLWVAIVVRKRGGKAGNGEESNCELHSVGLFETSVVDNECRNE